MSDSVEDEAGDAGSRGEFMVDAGVTCSRNGCAFGRVGRHQLESEHYSNAFVRSLKPILLPLRPSETYLGRLLP